MIGQNLKISQPMERVLRQMERSNDQIDADCIKQSIKFALLRRGLIAVFIDRQLFTAKYAITPDGKKALYLTKASSVNNWHSVARELPV